MNDNEEKQDVSIEYIMEAYRKLLLANQVLFSGFGKILAHANAGTLNSSIAQRIIIETMNDANKSL